MSQKEAVDCETYRDLVTEYSEQALSPSMALAMQRHKEKCERCEEFLSQIQLTVGALGSLKRERPADPIPQNLTEAFREWRQYLPDTAFCLEETLESLLDISDSDRALRIARIPSKSLGVIGRYAIDEATRLCVVRPKNALALAELAVECFIRKSEMEGPDQGETSVELGEAWAVLGNARRICSNFRGAGEAFRSSERILGCGPANAIARASYLQLRSTYLAECGDLAEAVKSIDEAISIFQEAGDSHMVGRALIGRGTLVAPFGDPVSAAENLQAGLELVNPEREPRLVLVAKHNLVHSLIDIGRRDQALTVLTDARTSHELLSNAVDLIRFKWLEGKIALDSGDLDEAERLFLEVKTYFVDQEMSHDVAVVSLDLAMVYLKQARTSELKSLAGEMITIFSGLGIRREIFAALTFFNKAQEIETTATVSLLQELADVVEKARQPGSLRPRLSTSNQV